MSQLGNLSAQDQSKVDAKLLELHQKTGNSWGCEITKQPQSNDGRGLLEITVDGHIALPVMLKDDANNPADHICSELERFYKKRLSSTLP